MREQCRGALRPTSVKPPHPASARTHAQVCREGIRKAETQKSKLLRNVKGKDSSYRYSSNKRKTEKQSELSTKERWQ